VGLHRVREMRVVSPRHRNFVGVANMSRYESTLLAQLDAESDPSLRSVLSLRLSSYWARKGEVARARDLIAEIRQKHAGGQSAQIFAHINFSEAMCEFFGGGILSALPKLLRSEILCTACPPDDDLPALVCVWAASFFRSMGNWSKMEIYLRSALQVRDKFSDEVCCRLALVIADSYQEIDNYSRADRWYKRARLHAMRIGDDSVVSAMLYNQSAIRIYNTRLSELVNDSSDLVPCDLALQAASAENYSLYSRDVSMPWMFDLLLGQLKLLQGQFIDALSRLESADVQGLTRHWPAVELVRKADVLRANVGARLLSSDQACSAAREIEEMFSLIDSPGDVAVAAYSVSAALGSVDIVFSDRLKKLSIDLLARYRVENIREQIVLTNIVEMLDGRIGE
jgi:tetratricopeptide (TPR) repeat protein